MPVFFSPQLQLLAGIYGTVLGMQVFGNDEYPPDAEFGCFQVVLGPLESDFAEQALLRLDVGEHFLPRHA